MTEDEVERNVVAILEIQSGKKASIDVSFDRFGMHNYEVLGTKGEIIATGTMCWDVGGEIKFNGFDGSKNVEFEHLEAVEDEIRQFCKAIDAGEEPPVPGEAGLHAQAVIDAIYESGKTKKEFLVKY